MSKSCNLISLSYSISSQSHVTYICILYAVHYFELNESLILFLALSIFVLAEMASFPAQLHSSEPKLKVAPDNSNASSQHADPYSASDDEIPTVDYSLLFSDDPHQRFLALEYLHQACEEFGFFYVMLS